MVTCQDDVPLGDRLVCVLTDTQISIYKVHENLASSYLRFFQREDKMPVLKLRIKVENNQF